MKIVAATNNKHKVSELTALFESQDTELVTLKEINFTDEIIEDGSTFLENARIKAMTVHKATGLPCIADDSGLCVDALGGEPGIYSARYASDNDENSDDLKNNEKLLSKLDQVPENERTARFVSALCFIDADGTEVSAIGKCEGIITREARGEGGFGYDPLFFFPGFGKTFGELTAEEKNEVSHRANAVKILKEKLEKYFSEK
ncbi:MAG: XTP/dITP diphosphatase [Ruminococcaceae bacterium]|nr:XTP/dITP diphosphatase [Oscillospiraceae bacterium]